jgi:hypothetical protein
MEFAIRELSNLCSQVLQEKLNPGEIQRLGEFRRKIIEANKTWSICMPEALLGKMTEQMAGFSDSNRP